MSRKRQRAAAKRKTFSEDNVLRLPAKDYQYLMWDAGTEAARGLAILVSPTGTRSFRVVYYFPGSAKPYYKHLGRVGELTLVEARSLARAARAAARRGDDPRADEASRSESFRAAVESYIKHEQVGRHGNKSAYETHAVMLNHCAEWLHRPVATIRYAEIEKLLWLIRDGDGEQRPRPSTANRLYSHLKDFFGWCHRRNAIKASPMADMEQPVAGTKSRDRDWFKKAAGDDAIKSLWRSADEIGGSEGRYLKLMILTGKRKTALANMRWEEIDDDWFWDAPPSEVANKRLHGVPLPGLAQRLLSPRQKQGKVFDITTLDGLQSRVRRISGMPDFFWHGVRHLCETKTAELRDKQGRPLIPPHVRDLLFDHASKRGSGAGYDHHDYKPEMRDAMEAWAGYVERLTTPEGVARLR
jgi:integrase